MNNKLMEHGFFSGMSKKKVREMLKEITNLSAYVDIDERTVGSTGKLYDLFDNSNNHSCGQIDLTKTKLTTSVVSGEIILTDKVENTEGFKVGQEITVQDITNVERPIVTRIGETTISTIDRQDSTVVASAYTTSASARPQRLSNGWLVTATYDATNSTTRFYVDKLDGNGFQYLCYRGTNLSGGISIASKGTFVYLYGAQTISSYFMWFDATTIPIGTQISNIITLDSAQTAYSGCSLAINSTETEMHATWSSKNATYPNSFNIRYAKGTIASDGSVTWGSVEQRTGFNSVGLDLKNPTIIVNNLGNPVIIFERIFSDSYGIRRVMFDGTSWTVSGSDASQYLYYDSSYIQSSPSAIFVPQSINGLANGRIWVAWHGKDSVDTTYENIRISYSDDNGVTWSTMEKLTITDGNAYYKPSISVNKNNKIFVYAEILSNTTGYRNVCSLVYDGTWSTVTMLTNFTTNASVNVSLCNNYTDFTVPLYVYKFNGISVNFTGTWQQEVYTPHLEITPLQNNYAKNALVYRSLGKVENNKLGFSDGFGDSITYDVQDSTVVASAYDTSGNGGRKLVRLSNRWLVAVVTNSNAPYLYVDKQDGNGFVQLCWISWTTLSGSKDVSIVSKNNYVYLIMTNNGSVQSRIIDVINQTNIDISSSYTLIVNNETAFNGVSLTINSTGTELHACWSSKNATRPNSFNIRYAKGTISEVDGSVTWESVTQITTRNTSGEDSLSPTIILNSNNYPVIIYSDYTGNYRIYSYRYDGTSWINSSTVYSVATYIQSSPSSIFVPTEINGLPQGRIWVAWHGGDNIESSANNIRVSYSDDGGVTWSAMQKITNGNIKQNVYVTVSANKYNEIFITFCGNGDGTTTDRYKLCYLKYSNNIWSGINVLQSVSDYNLSYSSSMYDINLYFSIPIVVYTNKSKVGFYGTWEEDNYIPLLQEDVRYNITPTTESETQAVLWVQNEKDEGVTIDSAFSMVDDVNNESYINMTNTNKVDIVDITENEFVYSGIYGHRITNRLTMNRTSSDLNKSITKILGAIGE